MAHATVSVVALMRVDFCEPTPEAVPQFQCYATQARRVYILLPQRFWHNVNPPAGRQSNCPVMVWAALRPVKKMDRARAGRCIVHVGGCGLVATSLRVALFMQNESPQEASLSAGWRLVCGMYS